MWNDRYSAKGFRERANMSWVATAILGAGAVGAAANIYSSKKAADVQSGKIADATKILQQQYGTMREDANPYKNLGLDAGEALTGFRNIGMGAAPGIGAYGDMGIGAGRGVGAYGNLGLGAAPGVGAFGNIGLDATGGSQAYGGIGLDATRGVNMYGASGLAVTPGVGYYGDVGTDAVTRIQNYLARGNEGSENLRNYENLGTTASDALKGRLTELTSPIVMDQAALEKTPGYQFTLQQGLKGVQNSAAARGLGNSGAALKGAATFATGLADNTYQTQFGLENTNRTNAFNRLKSLIDTGQGTSAGVAGLGADVGKYTAGLGSDAYKTIFGTGAGAYGNLAQLGSGQFANLSNLGADAYKSMYGIGSDAYKNMYGVGSDAYKTLYGVGADATKTGYAGGVTSLGSLLTGGNTLAKGMSDNTIGLGNVDAAAINAQGKAIGDLGNAGATAAMYYGMRNKSGIGAGPGIGDFGGSGLPRY